MTGARSHRAGLAAEDIALRHYEARGFRCLDRRWRGRSGEVDLVVTDGRLTVFVEVKSAADIDRALASLSARQIGRITGAASEYIGTALSPIRVDLAAVDRAGQVRIVENITV